MSRVSVLTNRGVSVVRAAQSKFKTVSIVDCLTSSHWENTANELATKPSSWYDGVVGQVKSVKSGGNHLKVQIEFPQTKDNQPLKSIGIRIKADDDDRLFILYAESDGNSAVTLGSSFVCEYDLPINVPVATIEPEGDYPDPEACGSSIEYDSNSKKIIMKNAEGETLSEIDATAFIKDGMLSSVTVSDGYMNFIFNTDAGKETISIPLTDFFDPSLYYTKADIDGGYLNNVSYNSATNTLSFSSEDGTRNVNINLD